MVVGVSIWVDVVIVGLGGMVVVWFDGMIWFDGSISVCGGV